MPDDEKSRLELINHYIRPSNLNDPYNPTWKDQDCIYLCKVLLDPEANPPVIFEGKISGVYQIRSIGRFLEELYKDGKPSGRIGDLEFNPKIPQFTIRSNSYIVIDISNTGMFFKEKEAAIVMSHPTEGVYFDLLHTNLASGALDQAAAKDSNIAFFSAQVEDEVIRFHHFDLNVPGSRFLASFDPEVRNDGHPPGRQFIRHPEYGRGWERR